MDDGLTTDEQRLLDALGEAVGRADPVPPQVLLAARSAIAWRGMDAALLEITRDTLATAGAEGVRDHGGSRLVSFEGDGGTVRFEVRDEAGSRALVGQVEPPGPPVVRARQGEREVSADVDREGRFTLRGLGSGPVSVLVEPGGPVWTRASRTGWLAI